MKIKFKFIYHHNIKIYNFKILPLNKIIAISLISIFLFNLSNLQKNISVRQSYSNILLRVVKLLFISNSGYYSNFYRFLIKQ